MNNEKQQVFVHFIFVRNKSKTTLSISTRTATATATSAVAVVVVVAATATTVKIMNNAPPLYNFSYSNQRLLQKPYSIQNQLSYPFGYASLIQGARNRRTQARHLISAYNTRVPTFPGNVVSRDLHPMMMMHTASVPASRGLELLRAASLQVPKRQIPKPSACVSAEPLEASASNNTATSKKKKKRIPKPSARNDKAPSKSKQGLVYIDKILESDILCGRGKQDMYIF